MQYMWKVEGLGLGLSAMIGSVGWLLCSRCGTSSLLQLETSERLEESWSPGPWTLMLRGLSENGRQRKN